MDDKNPLWHCEAEAVGLERDAGVCSPEDPFHNSPCGWMSADPEDDDA